MQLLITIMKQSLGKQTSTFGNIVEFIHNLEYVKFVCNSNSTKNEIIKLYRVKHEKERLC